MTLAERIDAALKRHYGSSWRDRLATKKDGFGRRLDDPTPEEIERGTREIREHGRSDET